MTSLRARLWIGAVLWTAGLLIATSIVLTHSMVTNPSLPRFVHHVFAHVPLLTMIAAVCLAVGALQVRRGLASFSELRARLTDVHAGREKRVVGQYPGEVAPLVADLNALLARQEEAVARAHAKAGDLAHGLKTPLAVLANEASRAEAAGHTELAALIQQQVDRMRRQVDYSLAHARAAASGAGTSARCAVVESVEALARTLRRLYADRGLAIDVDTPADHRVRVEREDLDELLGNLFDNACKWTRTRVVVASHADGQRIVITVDDDGPGIDPSQRDAMLRRGVRADVAPAGSGFGLAIVRDLAELYGGSIELDTAPQGGLRAKLVLPAA